MSALEEWFRHAQAFFARENLELAVYAAYGDGRPFDRVIREHENELVALARAYADVVRLRATSSGETAANEMDEHTASRLLASKQIFLEGEALVARPDPAGRILAALHLDLAVETVLKTVLSANGTPAQPQNAGARSPPRRAALGRRCARAPRVYSGGARDCRAEP